MDHGLEQLFPQVGYLTEEVEKLQRQSSPGMFWEKVGHVVRESPEINQLVKTQIDGQILALSDVMKIWVKDSVEPLKPQIEASLLEKFQILERSIETQSGQLFRLLNEQNRVTQECALKLRSETASRTTPAASRPGLDENFVKRLEELELKMAAAKEHSAQTKALFTMNDLLQKNWKCVQQEMVTQVQLKATCEKLQGDFQVEMLRSMSGEHTWAQNRFDHLRKETAERDAKIAQQFNAFSERLHSLETENAALKVKLAVQPQTSELFRDLLLAQAGLPRFAENFPPPLQQQTPTPSSSLPQGNLRSEVGPGISGFPEIFEPLLRSEIPNPGQRNNPLRLVQFDDFKLTGGGMVSPPLHREVERSEPAGFVDPFLFGPREFGSGPTSHIPEWGVNSVMVAPIEVAGAPNNSFLASHLGKDGSIPKFSGEPCDFDNFRWEFGRFLTQLENAQRTKFSDEIKLFFLEKALPEKEKNKLQLAQRMGHKVSCQGFLSQLGGRLMTTKETILRRKWKEIVLRHSGRMSVQDLHDFEMEFNQIREDLGDLSERECREHLLTKLPQHLTGWVGEQETRLRNERPQVSMNIGEEHTTAEIRATVQALFGISPRSIDKKGAGEYLLHFDDISDMKKVLELDGRSVSNGRFVAKVREVEQFYSVSQIFDFLATKLEARDRMDQYNRGPQPTDRYRSPTRDPRYVRITTDEPGETRQRDLPKSVGPTKKLEGTSSKTQSPASSRPSSPVSGRPGTPQRPATPPPPSSPGRGTRDSQQNRRRGGGHPRNSQWWWDQPQGKGGKGGKGKGKGKGDYWGGYGQSYPNQNYGGKGNPYSDAWNNGPPAFYPQQQSGWQNRPGHARNPQSGQMMAPPQGQAPPGGFVLMQGQGKGGKGQFSHQG